jgi:GNAT superfamily N-acetyltransferase
VVADAAGIARVQLAGWEWAYRGIMTDEVLDALDPDDRRARWHDILADDGNTVVAVPVGDGVIAGFASIGPCRDRDRMGAGEVYALYVDPARAGRGIGAALLGAAVETLRRDGYERLVLWVLAANRRARRFYQAQGWQPDGCQKPSPWGPPEVRYELAAAPPSPP